MLGVRGSKCVARVGVERPFLTPCVGAGVRGSKSVARGGIERQFLTPCVCADRVRASRREPVVISQLAQPIVDRLVAAVDCTVHVGAVTCDEMVYIIRTDSSKPYRMRSRVGLAIPMHSTGMGKAAMASWDDEAIGAYAERTGLPGRTDSTITDVDGLRQALAEVRERGYALDLGENEVGTVCVAAPIRNHAGRVTHGLSISSIALEHPGTSIESLAPHAVQAAAEISRVLGASV
ncbi:MAG: IclR family transcriptional regulator [Pseudoclavibacter sp.]